MTVEELAAAVDRLAPVALAEEFGLAGVVTDGGYEPLAEPLMFQSLPPRYTRPCHIQQDWSQSPVAARYCLPPVLNTAYIGFQLRVGNGPTKGREC